MNRPRRALRSDSVLVVVDVQEKLYPLMQGRESLVANLGILLGAAARLGVPVLVTEQYPRGLGATIGGLDTGAAPRIAKSAFSAFGEPEFVAALRGLERGTLVLAGIEAHICVLQTALDGRERGFDIHVVADAVATRIPGNLAPGLERARAAGSEITTTESVVFEWLERAGTDDFRAILPLIR